MFSKILPLLNKFLPPTLAAKALGKMDSRFARFFTNTLASGYATDKALSFLRNRFMGEKDENEQQLEQGQAQGTLRPDEQASLQNIRHSQAIPNAIGTAASMAPVIGAGMSALRSGQGQQPQQEQPQPTAPETQTQSSDAMGSLLREMLNKNPKLTKLIEEMIGQGKSSSEIARETRQLGMFSKIINEVQQKFGADWANLIEKAFGVGGNKKEGGKSSNGKSFQEEFLRQMKGNAEILMNRYQQRG